MQMDKDQNTSFINHERDDDQEFKRTSPQETCSISSQQRWCDQTQTL